MFIVASIVAMWAALTAVKHWPERPPRRDRRWHVRGPR